MVPERLKKFFKRVKERLREAKPEDVAIFATKEIAGKIPVIGSIIKDAIEEFSPNEKKELINELKDLSENQFKEISNEVGESIGYLKDIQKLTFEAFGELRADHGEIKELLYRLLEKQTQDVVNIPTIQSVLRKGEDIDGEFFRKKPLWVDFEEGFIVERKEVDEIIKGLDAYNIRLVIGEPASGKSIILKDIGFKLVNENRKVCFVELKECSRDKVKSYFECILKVNDEKTVFIVDDAHLYFTECESLISDFKNLGKDKLIIGSRETKEIKGEHPKETSSFEYLKEKSIHIHTDEDITGKMIKMFLRKKNDINDNRMNRVSKNLERYKKDLWVLSWALKAFKSGKDFVEEAEFYKNIKESITCISTGKDETEINAEDALLPLSFFYRFEIPIERDFVEEQLGIDENTINQLITLSEIVETEEIGKKRMLSLNHSSIAELYYETYESYPDLGKKIRNIIVSQKNGDTKELEYCLFHQYLTALDSRNVVSVINSINYKGGRTVLQRLKKDGKIQKTIKEGIENEENLRKIGLCVSDIVKGDKEVGRKLVNLINIDSLSSKIEKEENIDKIGMCVSSIAEGSKEVGRKLVNLINMDLLSSKIEKEEDIIRIGLYVSDIVKGDKEVVRKLVNLINIDSLSSKIEEEEDIDKIGWCVSSIAEGSKEVGRELANLINIDLLSSKIEEEDIDKIGMCVSKIAKGSKELVRKLVNLINIDLLSSKIEKEDIDKIGECVSSIAEGSKEVGRELANLINIDLLSSRIEKEEDIDKIGWCVRSIAEGSKEVAMKLVDSVSSRIEKGEDIEEIEMCLRLIADVSKDIEREIVSHLNPKLREKLRK